MRTERRVLAEQYRTCGYAVLRRFFGHQEVARWRERFDALVLDPGMRHDPMIVMRDVMVVKNDVRPRSPLHAVTRIHNLGGDAVLGTYVRHERLLDVVEDLVGPGIALIHSMMINKVPDVDGRQPFHQDLHYFGLRPADSIVGTWTALEPAAQENGCIAVLPASHKLGLLPHQQPPWQWVNAGYRSAVGSYSMVERVYIPMSAGDLLLLHPLLLHASGRNRTSRFRRAITAHFASLDCHEVSDARPEFAGTQPMIVRSSRELLPVTGNQP